MIKVSPPIPRRCPKCGTSEAYPFVGRTVLRRQYGLELDVRCRACEHEFHVVIEDMSRDARVDG